MNQSSFLDSAGPGHKGSRNGTHRLIAPAETLSRVQPHLAAMGITRVADVTGLDRIGVPVVMVTRPNARSIAVAQGKGLDLDAARASGVMEAIEFYHGEHIELPLKLAACSELRARHPVIAVDRLPPIAGSRFEDHRPMLWIEGLELLGNRPVWLPYETVHNNFTLPLPPGSGSFPASTNGLASGNHPLEAICHAIAELIERDATTLWRRRPLTERQASRIDLESVADPDCRRVIGKLAAAGIAAAAFETTSDLGVPAFFVVLLDTENDLGHPGIGAGCHPVPAVALLRALSEAVQVRMTYVSGVRVDVDAEEFTLGGRARKLEPIRTLMADTAPPRPFPEDAGEQRETFADDLAWLLDRLRAAGIEEVVVVDLAKPWFPLAVVKVVIPGLEGIDEDSDYLPGARATAQLANGA
jgi:ribosomal protein S12 methylthiotransferase accessory factor